MDTNGNQLFVPLMPQGVEHTNNEQAAAHRILQLFVPLMPQGVEHRIGRKVATNGY